MPNETGTTPRTDDSAEYERLAAILRKQISDGAYERRRPAPTITELTRDHGWSRETCAKALKLLEGEGLLTHHAGLGYYISPRPPRA